MRIKHHISVPVTPETKKNFASAGIDLEAMRKEGRSFAAFDITEEDPRWPALAIELSTTRAVDSIRTSCTGAELDSATYSTCNWRWEHGYPQPEDGYKQTTYDDSAYCKECGTGLVQKEPFRMRGEPRWGKHSLLTLFWIGDSAPAAHHLSVS